jgi:nitrite reductase/ring-hydroxylating ferredoxin subunit
MATKRKRIRYEIRETSDRDGIREFLVGTAGQLDYERAGVWVSSDGVARCVECQGRLTAMLASCPHARAVRRYLNDRN